VDVWTSRIGDKVLNIFHCHLSDRNESVPVEVLVMGEGKTKEEYYGFEKDASGEMLRYKILVLPSDLSIHAILYNTGPSVVELDFKEHQIAQSTLMQAYIPEYYEETPIIIEVSKIPTSMTCSSSQQALSSLSPTNLENFTLTSCKMRYFERLPGLVDVNLLSSDNLASLLSPPTLISLPICQCSPMDPVQETLLFSLQEHEKIQMKDSSVLLIKKLQSMVIIIFRYDGDIC
jgi:hypothetical protein